MNDVGQAPFSAAEDLEPRLAQSLWTFGVQLSEAKRLLGLRSSEWITGAPTLEATVALAAITQDELGHARSLMVAFQGFPNVPAELRDQSPKASLLETQSPFLSRPLDSWFDLIAMNVVLDEAVRVAVEAARDSRFLPLRQRVDKILQEEQYHRTFGAGWLAQLRGQGEAGRRRLREATDAMTAAGRDWFAYLAVETDFDDLLSAAVLASSPDQQQQEWQNRMHASLGSLHH